jgi:hypothetical protein
MIGPKDWMGGIPLAADLGGWGEGCRLAWDGV